MTSGTYLRPDDGFGHYADCGHACPCYKAGFDERDEEIAELRLDSERLRRLVDRFSPS